MPIPLACGRPAEVLGSGKVTIGEALEAAGLSEGEKLIDKSDAAAIQAAEMRATGLNETLPGGVAAQAQSAASINACVPPASSERTTLGEVLSVPSFPPKSRPQFDHPIHSRPPFIAVHLHCRRRRCRTRQ